MRRVTGNSRPAGEGGGLALARPAVRPFQSCLPPGKGSDERRSELARPSRRGHNCQLGRNKRKKKRGGQAGRQASRQLAGRKMRSARDFRPVETLAPTQRLPTSRRIQRSVRASKSSTADQSNTNCNHRGEGERKT